jgi:hypothetical protein
MSRISKRLVSIAASTLVLSLVSASANAQSDVISGGALAGVSYDATSSYKFTDSMILNSIGFFTNNHTTYQSLEFTLKGQTYRYNQDFFDNNLTNENGFLWLTIYPQPMVSNEIVTVYTKGRLREKGFVPFSSLGTETDLLYNFTFTPNTNVSYEGLVTGAFGNVPNSGYTNSNLRVSPANPGSNVAPEPGSFALALTGGGALLGICIRRRRNAA